MKNIQHFRIWKKGILLFSMSLIKYKCTITYLADTFIQSDLKMKNQAIHLKEAITQVPQTINKVFCLQRRRVFKCFLNIVRDLT